MKEWLSGVKAGQTLTIVVEAKPAPRAAPAPAPRAAAPAPSVREIKALLDALGGTYADCTEKHELVTRLREVEAAQGAGPQHDQAQPDATPEDLLKHLTEEINKAAPGSKKRSTRLHHTSSSSSRTLDSSSVAGRLGNHREDTHSRGCSHQKWHKLRRHLP